MHPFVYLLVFTLSTVLILAMVQSRPSFLLILPIMLASIGIGWYVDKHIQFEFDSNDHEIKHWFHRSFIPKKEILLKKHIKETIMYCGILLLGLTFFWSYFVAGLLNAVLCVFIAALLYSGFIFYILHADKWYNNFFDKILPKHKHLKKNEWIQGYVVFLPFSFLCLLIYVVFNYSGTLLATLAAIPLFLFVYTMVFVSLYCGIHLYNEYEKANNS